MAATHRVYRTGVDLFLAAELDEHKDMFMSEMLPLLPHVNELPMYIEYQVGHPSTRSVAWLRLFSRANKTSSTPRGINSTRTVLQMAIFATAAMLKMDAFVQCAALRSCAMHEISESSQRRGVTVVAQPLATTPVRRKRLLASAVTKAGGCANITTATPAVSRGARAILAAAAIALLLVSMDRTMFSVAVVPMAAQLSLKPTQSGVLLAAFLCGSAATNMVGGLLADAVGGAHVLAVSMAWWSLAVCGMPWAALWGVPGLAACRVLLGAASGVALPAASALVAATVPATSRAFALAAVFGCFNLGSALGLIAGGLLPVLGWRTLFRSVGVAGVTWAALLCGILRAVSPSPHAARATLTPVPAAKAAGASSIPKIARAVKPPLTGKAAFAQMCGLVYTHGVLNWAFFTLQSWTPTYMASELALDVRASALLGSAPWFAMAITSVVAGKFADRLLVGTSSRQPWAPRDVRRLMVSVATLGPAAAFTVLAGAGRTAAGTSTLTPAVAVVGLAVALAAYAFSIAGYHAYIQDVAPKRAGAILGLTNTLGTAAASVANIVTGHLLQSTGSFAAVFALAATLCATSALQWNLQMRGDPLFDEVQ